MKIKTRYVCQECGTNSPKWLGKCTGCGGWNTFVEETIGGDAEPGPSSLSSLRDSLREGESSLKSKPKSSAWIGEGESVSPFELLDEESTDNESGEKSVKLRTKRLNTGMQELNRVLGGGLVPDSLTLLGGDPGIGKSTILLQMAKGICEHQPNITILYVSGEESADQIRSRAHRLGILGKKQIYLACETQLERVIASIKELKPNVVLMDSLQTFSTGYLESAPGSVSQVREVAARLCAVAKTLGLSVWLVGHVTKDGTIAGPKVVEHIVDTVLYFEGDGGQSYRLLRTVKNRFGSARELGVFEMEGEGLREVLNPSSLFLSDRTSPVAGTAIAASLEGSRPILVEVQALVVQSNLPQPRRTSVGFENSRTTLISAILERHMRLTLSGYDLFFNVAGGLRLTEPAIDLAAAAAIWSSYKEFAFPQNMIFLGELGLTGEVRRVNQIDVRLEEAKRLGFKSAVVPKGLPKPIQERYKMDMELHVLSRIEELPRLFSS